MEQAKRHSAICWFAAVAVLWLTVVGLGASSRVSCRSITRDEAFTWRLSTGDKHRLLSQVSADTHPPGHFILLAYWIGIFGDSLLLMRILSVLLNGMTVAGVFLLTKTAAAIKGGRFDEGRITNTAACLSSAMIIVHAGQLEMAWTARMYSLAVASVVWSNYFLLRAVYVAPKRITWACYISVTVVAIYSHYFAVFVIAAQIAFVAAIGFWRYRGREKPSSLSGMAFSVLFVLTVYSLWIPSVVRQALRVQASFWIPALRPQTFFDACGEWSFGDKGGANIVFTAWVALIVAVTVWRARRADSITVLFSLQVVLPWAAILVLYLVSGRSLLQAKYLLMSQAALAVLCGILCERIRGFALRLSWCLTVLAPFFPGTAELLILPVSESNSLGSMASTIARPTSRELVLVPSPAEVNVMRFYFAALGQEDVQIKCRVPEVGPGHLNHLASMLVADLLWDESAQLGDFDRIYTVNEEVRGAGWHSKWRCCFASSHFEEPGYVMSVYERQKPSCAKITLRPMCPSR